MLSNDTGIHAPLTSGPYAYNAFTPGSGGFPATGAEFTDPVFGASNTEGSIIRRLTSDNPTDTQGQDIYGHHWLNADGTHFFWTTTAGARTVKRVSDGSIVRSGISWTSTAGDISWHPTDPNSYFYFNGSDIRKYNVSAGTSVAVNSAGKFPSALQKCGGENDFVDATGTKFVIQYGGAGHIYDSTSDTVYSGTGPGAITTGSWNMRANANHAIFTQGGSFTAYPLDNVGHSIGASFPFWIVDGGTHAGYVSASNGKNYMLRSENKANGYYYIVEVKDQSGKTDNQIRADNVQLFTNGWVMDSHLSGVGKGAFQDWVFLSTEYPNDTFNSNTSGWLAYEQEIIAVNVLTHEIRRLCHHRSRSIAVKYDYEPRVSCAWDGSVVMWASNFNLNNGGAGGYIDAWAILNPLGGSDISIDEQDWLPMEQITNPLIISKW